MNEAVLEQLHDLAKSFNKIGLEPVICGGLGIYLWFCNRQRDIELRATNDIDLMVTQMQARNEVARQSILKAITNELNYVLRSEGQCFMFQRPPYDKLDVLAPPIAGLTRENDFRVRLVKSKLHGRLTPEAAFIEEDLETIHLHDIFTTQCDSDCCIQLPSLTNLLIMKLFAFDDRHKAKNYERAEAHAYDIFVITALSDRTDYLKSRAFMSRHVKSEIISKAKSVIFESFREETNPGWQYVLRAGVYGNLGPNQRFQKIRHTANRLVRWFAIS